MKLVLCLVSIWLLVLTALSQSRKTEEWVLGKLGARAIMVSEDNSDDLVAYAQRGNLKFFFKAFIINSSMIYLIVRNSQS